MPIYPYKCAYCGHEFEVQHGVNAPVRKKCPKCGKKKLKRQIPERTSFSLVGGGWGSSGYS